MANTRESSFSPSQLIRSSEINRNLHLLKNVLLQSPSGLLAQIKGGVDFDTLSPELQDIFNSLLIMTNPQTDVLAPIMGQQTYSLTSSPIATSVLAVIDGATLMPADYTISGTTITFIPAITGTEEIMVRYNTQDSLPPPVYTSFSLADQNVIGMEPTLYDAFFAYGLAKVGGAREVGRYRQIDSALLGTFDVSSGSPNNNMMVRAGGYVWAIGAPTGTNKLTRIYESNPTLSSLVTVSTDTGVIVSSIAADTTYIYALMKGGTLITPNSISKMTMGGSVVGVINTGITTPGDTSLVVSSTGFLYAAFADPSTMEVRKIDPMPINGIPQIYTFTSPPTFLLPVGTDIYVISGYDLYSISSVTDVRTLLHTYAYEPSGMIFDGVNLWLTHDDTLVRCNLAGDEIDVLVPQSAQDILSLMSTSGFIWTGY